MLAPSARSGCFTVTATVFTLALFALDTLGSTPITFAADADLVMTIVSGPTSATKGEQIVILNRVMNQGTADTVSEFTVGLYLSTDMEIDPSTDILLDTRTVPCCLVTIGIRRASQVNTQVTIPSSVSPGTYFLGAYADIPPPLGMIAESDESNNALAGNSITIDSSGKGSGDGGGCGRITFGDDDHPRSGTVTGDFVVLCSLLMYLYVKRYWRPWAKVGTSSIS